MTPEADVFVFRHWTLLENPELGSSVVLLVGWEECDEVHA